MKRPLVLLTEYAPNRKAEQHPQIPPTPWFSWFPSSSLGTRKTAAV